MMYKHRPSLLRNIGNFQKMCLDKAFMLAKNGEAGLLIFRAQTFKWMVSRENSFFY
jgi:hypothetical protein